MATNHYENVRTQINNGGPISAFDWMYLAPAEKKMLGSYISERGFTVESQDGLNIFLRPVVTVPTPGVQSADLSFRNKTELINAVYPNGYPKTWAALNAEFQYSFHRYEAGEIDLTVYATELTTMIANYLKRNDALDATITGGTMRNPNLK